MIQKLVGGLLTAVAALNGCLAYYSLPFPYPLWRMEMENGVRIDVMLSAPFFFTAFAVGGAAVYTLVTARWKS